MSQLPMLNHFVADPRDPAGDGGHGSATRPGPAPMLDGARQARLCAALADHGNVRLACRAAGVSPQTAYRLRRVNATFRRLWDGALVIAREKVEQVLADRAINGFEEAVFYHGEEVARRTRYDSRLLLAHLARLDRLAEGLDVAALAEGFDAALDALERGEAVPDPLAGAPVGTGASNVVPDGADDHAGLAADGGESDADAGEGDGVPLLEAQLRWLEARFGPLSEADEAFHLQNTVPGVPGSALSRFGWRGDGG